LVELASGAVARSTDPDPTIERIQRELGLRWGSLAEIGLPATGALMSKNQRGSSPGWAHL